MSALVEPAYGAHSLAEVVPGIAAALGLGAGAALELPSAPSYVLFLIDGLGAEQLDTYADAAPYLSSLVGGYRPLTASVPSTTATSIATLGTALPPGAHGIVGYTSRIPGTERLLHALAWDKAVDPRQWQPQETAFGALRAAGATVTVVNRRSFADSGLTVAAQRGADFVGADRVGERIAAAVSLSAAAPSMTYLYDGDLDWTGHRHGVGSAAWLQQLAMIDAEAEQLRDALPSATRVLIVADHGMINSPESARIDVDRELALRDGVSLLGGEARFRHLYCRNGAVPSVMETWQAVLGARAMVLTRSEAIARGWFGPVSPGVLPRLGDVVVAALDDLAVLSSVDFPYETTLVGLHGSLTSAEMSIPCLVD